MGRTIDKSLKEQVPSEVCYYCGCTLNNQNRTYDHVIPVSKGGKDDVTNLVACCSCCNQVKKNFTLFELLNTLDRQKDFCDDEVRMARLEYYTKIFSIARRKLSNK